jgi:pimeloyl-ACP methyl ester carboxylesterase
LGTLTNKVASVSSTNHKVAKVQASIPTTNSWKTVNGQGLTKINGKFLNYQKLGKESGPPIIFIHGLGGTLEYWRSFADTYLTSNSVYLFDLEGHGLSPTSPLSVISIESFVADLKGVFEYAKIESGATLIAHSMGCLIAMSFAISNPGLVKNLILTGPPPSPLPEFGSKVVYGRAEKARTQGMASIADDLAAVGLSSSTKEKNRLVITAVRLSLLGQDPESYAKACTALTGAKASLEVEKIQARTLIITGDEDKVSPPELCKEYAARLQAPPPVVLEQTGHWHVFESEATLSKAVTQFLSS